MKALQFSVIVPKFIAAKALASIFGRRVYYQGPLKTVKIADIPEPTLPTKDWVKIKTIYCGFCGSDLNLIQLHDSPTASPFTSFPCVIGHEIVGEIIETGSDVNKFKSGDIVAINPVLACEARMTALGRQVWPHTPYITRERQLWGEVDGQQVVLQQDGWAAGWTPAFAATCEEVER